MINKKLLSYASVVKKELFEAVFLKYALFLLNLTLVWISAWLIEGMFSENDPGERVVFFITVAVAIAVLRFLINLRISSTGFKISTKVQTRIRRDIYDKVLDLELEYIEKSGTSSLVSLAVEGVEMLEVYFARYLPQLFYSLTVPFVLFAVLFNLEWRAPLVMLLSVPLIPISIIFFMKKAKRIMKSFWNTYEGMSSDFLENVQGLVTLKLYNRDVDISVKMRENAEKFRERTMKVLSVQLSSIFIMDFFSLLGAAVGIVVVVISFMNGRVDLGSAVIIILLSSEFFIPMRMLGALFHAGMNGVAASDNIFSFLNEVGKSRPGEMQAEEVKRISFKDVTFSYDGKRDVLKDVSFDISKGDKIAIVGKSGSGKSTIGSLILRFSDVEKGRIEINGTELSEYDKKDLRKQIAMVSQHTYVFNSTIRDNLLVANENATDDQMFDALRTAGLEDFVRSLPEGLDAATGEWGKLFSGGQKQRIALARAILKDSSFYIFDEATSNVDADNEADIWKNIFEISKDRTSIIISHRLSVVKNLDRILVVEEGRLVESGTHDELIKSSGLYAQMYSEQSELESEVGEQ